MKSNAPLDSAARSWLDAADREYDPSPADRTRIRARLDQALSAGVGTALLSNTQAAEAAELAARTSTAPAAAAGGLGWGTKAIVGALLVGGAGFGSGYWAGHRDAAGPAAAPGPADARELGSSEHGTRHTPNGATPAAGAPAPAPKAAELDARGASERDVARLAEPGSTVGAPDDVEPKIQTPALWQETQLLRRAQVALRAGNGRLAASLLDELAAEFPNGALVEERAAARVLTDCALGQVERARSRAARFLADYPNSVHAERVRASCAKNQASSRDEEP